MAIELGTKRRTIGSRADGRASGPGTHVCVEDWNLGREAQIYNGHITQLVLLLDQYTKVLYRRQSLRGRAPVQPFKAFSPAPQVLRFSAITGFDDVAHVLREDSTWIAYTEECVAVLYQGRPIADHPHVLPGRRARPADAT
jgi:hypothetical protein